MILTNTETICGFEITETLGVVRGNTVRAKHLGRDVMAGLKSIVGGEIAGYTELLTDARDQAEQRMIEEARKLGADAVINIRFETCMIAATASEMLVYGTAVKTRKSHQLQPD